MVNGKLCVYITYTIFILYYIFWVLLLLACTIVCIINKVDIDFYTLVLILISINLVQMTGLNGGKPCFAVQVDVPIRV